MKTQTQTQTPTTIQLCLYSLADEQREPNKDTSFRLRVVDPKIVFIVKIRYRTLTLVILLSVQWSRFAWAASVDCEMRPISRGSILTLGRVLGFDRMPRPDVQPALGCCAARAAWRISKAFRILSCDVVTCAGSSCRASSLFARLTACANTCAFWSVPKLSREGAAPRASALPRISRCC